MRRISHFNLNAYTGLLAALAALIALVISAPFAAAYFRAYGSGEPIPPWLLVFARANPELLNFALPSRVYQVYGRVFSLVIPLTIPVLLTLKEQMGTATRLSQWGWWTFFGGLLLFGVGVAGDYWPDQDSFWVGMGFLFELAGMLVFWVGSVLYGVAARREGSIHRWIGSGLIGIAPGGILGMVLLAHIPSGPLFGYVIFWLLFGLALAFGKNLDEF